MVVYISLLGNILMIISYSFKPSSLGVVDRYHICKTTVVDIKLEHTTEVGQPK